MCCRGRLVQWKNTVRFVNFSFQGTVVRIRFTPGFFQARSFLNFANILDLESSKYVAVFRITQPLLEEKLLQQSHWMKGIHSPIKLALWIMGFKRCTHNHILYYSTLHNQYCNIQKYQSYSLTNGGAQEVYIISQDRQGTVWHSKALRGDRWEDNRTRKKNHFNIPFFIHQ